MAKIKSNFQSTSLPDVVNGAVGPFKPYCMGYLNPGASGYGYISTLKLSTEVVRTVGLDPGTEGPMIAARKTTLTLDRSIC